MGQGTIKFGEEDKRLESKATEQDITNEGYGNRCYRSFLRSFSASFLWVTARMIT
jgi:hypothetical protein